VSSGSRPPRPRVFFLDRSLGRKVVAEALRRAGAEVEVHADHFAGNAPDEEWLAEAGRRGWVVLTKDQRIRYRHTELVALVKARVAAFVLVSGDLRGDEMAKAFVEALPRMSRLLDRQPAPFIARVTSRGWVSLLE
jgi:predicted nuclease of predicted toxin-antitoxin system